MQGNLKIIGPTLLPGFWDARFPGRIFLRRAFLEHLAKTNPAEQFCFYSDSDACTGSAGAVYLTRLPFCLGPVCLGAPVAICGVPMVYGSQSGFAPESAVHDAAAAMEKARPGFQIIIGLEQATGKIAGWTWKRHLITVDLNNRWDDFSRYLNAMRSDYRKQVVASLRKWEGVKVELKSASHFTRRDYELFIDMYRAARDKSAPLTVEFFRQLPIEHHYIKACHNGTELGWALLIPDGRILHLLYLGYDIPSNRKFDIYVNLLLESIKYAVENKYECLRMGQTAELIKMRIGGTPSERYMLVRHTNPVVNQIINRTDIFNFRKFYPPMHVFKDHEK